MNVSLVKPLVRIISFMLACWLLPLAHAAAPAVSSARQTLTAAALAEDDAQKIALLGALTGQGDDAVPALLAAWRADALFIYTAPDAAKFPVQLTGPKADNDAQDALRLDTGKPLLDAAGKPLRLIGTELIAVEHNANLRRAMKAVLDLAEIRAFGWGARRCVRGRPRWRWGPAGTGASGRTRAGGDDQEDGSETRGTQEGRHAATDVRSGRVVPRGAPPLRRA